MSTQGSPRGTPDSKLTNRKEVDAKARKDINCALNDVLADVFSLYLKINNFHWHMNGPLMHDRYQLLGEHGHELLALTDAIAERTRKIGGLTIRSIEHIACLQRICDNDADHVTPAAMMTELNENEVFPVLSMRSVHPLCFDGRDVATARLLGNWIEQAERRAWFLFEATGI